MASLKCVFSAVLLASLFMALGFIKTSSKETVTPTLSGTTLVENKTTLQVESYESEKVQLCRRQFLPFITKMENQGIEKKRPVAVPDLGSCKQYVAEARMKREVHKNINNLHITADSFNVTYVTQLTVEKISTLNAVATHWKGPISAAIYIKRAEIRETLFDVLCNSPQLNGRRNIVYSVVIVNGTYYYPVNVLRNAALRASQTPYVFLADVDLLPKPNLDREVHKSLQDGILNGSKSVLVIPAFEGMPLDGQAFKMPRNKTQLLKYLKEDKARIFLNAKNSFAYGPTLYDKWKTANKSYVVNYQLEFEPYIVMKKAEVPEYDERFLQRFKNKVEQLERVHYLGYKFRVLPEAFVVHLPHWRTGEKYGKNFRKCSGSVYKFFEYRMKKMYPKEFAALFRKWTKAKLLAKRKKKA